MSIEQEIDQRIQQLRVRKWVPGVPRYEGFSCAVYDGGVERMIVSRETWIFLNRVVADETGCHRGITGIVDYNDRQTSVEPVIAMMEKARAKAGEEGI